MTEIRRFRGAPVLLICLALLASAGGARGADQPYASHWFPNDLLAWTAGTDPDADFNRGGVPLADRFTDPSTQVNAHARDGEGRINAIGVMYPSTSNNPSQGSENFDSFTFDYWPYVDNLVFWGGSAGEGLILAPNAGVIDAAHRNGVPVLGTIFFPPTVYGGQIQWVEDLLQKDGPVFPVADKLIEAAVEYGFDGWFVNQETAGGDSALALSMQEFLLYLQANKPAGMRIMWYDAMIHNGNIAWQNELNENNVMFFQEGGAVVSDDIFLNFNWRFTTKLDSSRALALSLGRDPYEVYGGVDVQANGYTTGVDWDGVFPEGNVHTTSLGFYGAEWPWSAASSHYDYLARANRFWVGPNGDPSNTATADAWKGLAHYVPARSPMNDLPFMTSFGNGQGHLYAVAGEIRKVGDWNQRGLQDVLPTWRWLRSSPGDTLDAALDWGDAYEGGSCLLVSGDLGPANPTDLRLYKTALALSAEDTLVVAFRRGAAGSPSRLKVNIAFADAPGVYVPLDAGNSTGEGWTKAIFPLAPHAGRTIEEIGLRFESASSEPGYEIRIGRIGIQRGPVDVPGAPSNLVASDFAATGTRTGNVRVAWDAAEGPVRLYHVYQVNPDGSRTFLGGTSNRAWFAPEVSRVADETRTTIEVVAVSDEYGFSAPETTSVFWGLDPPNDPPVADGGGPYVGVTGAPLPFFGRGSSDGDGSIASWSWTFGDAGSSPEPDPAHAYALAGIYEVVLTVTDDDGAGGSDTTTATIADTIPDPVARALWLPLDEGSGSVAGDSSGNGNDGAVTGAVWTGGITGSALDFDGVDDHAIVGDYPKPASVMTVSVWAKAGSRSFWGSIVKNWGRASGAFRIGLWADEGDLEVRVTEADDHEIGFREGFWNKFPLGEWQHLAITADGARLRIYRNGAEIGNMPYDGTLKTSRPGLGIGVKLNNLGTVPNGAEPGWWDGTIDDIRIYDRALGANEIRALHQNGVGTGVESPGSAPPPRFALGKNAPNPFNPATRIAYELAERSTVTLAIYDIAGRRVRVLVDGVMPAGNHAATWDGRNGAGRDVASGIYFAKMAAGSFEDVRKMVLLR
ncbi:MAG: LamG-like jellyroll fold domain-containing protein [Candidatus Eisenbacteria bacterium]